MAKANKIYKNIKAADSLNKKSSQMNVVGQGLIYIKSLCLSNSNFLCLFFLNRIKMTATVTFFMHIKEQQIVSPTPIWHGVLREVIGLNLW